MTSSRPTTSHSFNLRRSDYGCGLMSPRPSFRRSGTGCAARMLPSVIGGPGGCLAFIAQTLIALADLPSGCRAWAALPDCNSRDRSRILGADEHLLRVKSYGHEDRPDPACGHERPHTAGEARLFARRHGHRPG